MRANNIEKLYKSVSPMFWLVRIFGVSVFEVPLGQPWPKLSFLYTLSLWSAYFAVSSCAFRNLAFKDDAIPFVIIVHSVVIWMNIAMLLITTTIRFLTYKSIRHVIERVAMIDETLDSLGIEIDYEQQRKKNRKILLLWAALWFVKLMCGQYNFEAFFDMQRAFLANLLNQIPTQLNSLVEISFVIFILTLGDRFEYVNEVTRSLTKAAVYDDYSKYDDNSDAANPRQTLSNDDVKKNELEFLLASIRQLHLELCAISRVANGIYSKYLAMLMGSMFVHMVGYLYSLYLYYNAPMLAIPMKMRHFVGHIPPVLLAIVRLIYIIKACESVTTEALRTSRIAHEIELSKSQSEIICEIEQLSLQILQHPLVFKASGSLVINFSLLQGFAGSISAYLIILIQNQPLFAKSTMKAVSAYFNSKRNSSL